MVTYICQRFTRCCQFAGMQGPAVVMALLAAPVTANWDAWWTYDGISGPAYWGLINPAWTMCNKASPYSFLTDNALFDSQMSLDYKCAPGAATVPHQHIAGPAHLRPQPRPPQCGQAGGERETDQHRPEPCLPSGSWTGTLC